MWVANFDRDPDRPEKGNPWRSLCLALAELAEVAGGAKAISVLQSLLGRLPEMPLSLAAAAHQHLLPRKVPELPKELPR